MVTLSARLEKLAVRLTTLHAVVHAANRPGMREGLRNDVRGELGGMIKQLNEIIDDAQESEKP